MLSYSERKPRLDANGQPVTRWDGHSTKPHPVTGQEVPDETARTITYDYLDPKPATWPEADFIVGNPPFIGDKTMRSTLGDGYVDALRKVYKGTVPESADFVMFWWQKAAEIVQAEKAERFGFITTNSIKQPFNRRVIQAFFDSKKPLNLDYAIPDHPWIDSADGAQVRIAVTVASLDSAVGRVDKVFKEIPAEGEWKVSFTEKIGTVNPDLTVGADLTSTVSLNANSNLSSVGMGLYGTGFLITLDEAKKLGRGEIEGMESVIKPYLNGRDFTQTSRGLFVIDLFGYTEEQARTKFPQVYQHVLNNVKPERDQNNRASYRKNWWYFGEARATFRPSLKSLDRYIITTQTARHRVFSFFDKQISPDNTLVAISLDDSLFLWVLSSEIHTAWSSVAGGRLGVGNDSRYNSTRCFQPFPFPTPTEAQQEQIRGIAEQLDAHRKQRQAQHPTLTITDMYNVLEKLRSGEALNAKEQKTHEQGLVSILLQLHQELDAAVAAAYGWPNNLPEEAILERLVALNKERAAEEARGHIRWLRPAYQNPQGAQQADMGIEAKAKTIKATAKEVPAWPKTLSEQAQAVQRALQLHERPATAEDLLHQFKPIAKLQQPQRLQQIDSLLQTLHGLGLLRKTEQDQYVK